MRFSDLLKGRLMGVYIDVFKGDELVKSVYQGMEGTDFVIATSEDLEEGQEVVLKLNIGGWNLEFPCVVKVCTDGRCVLEPKGKVRIREKRKEKRVPCVIPCKINGKRGTLLDVSFHGTRVLTLEDFDLKARMKLEIGDRSLEGYVRWKRDEEVDLKSIGLSIDEPPTWWMNLVRDYLGRYVTALRRL